MRRFFNLAFWQGVVSNLVSAAIVTAIALGWAAAAGYLNMLTLIVGALWVVVGTFALTSLALLALEVPNLFGDVIFYVSFGREGDADTARRPSYYGFIFCVPAIVALASLGIIYHLHPTEIPPLVRHA